MLATLNKELSQTQDVNERLSEETMALEELRKDKENLQAQLDKVQGELEDFDRVSSPTVLADQVYNLLFSPAVYQFWGTKIADFKNCLRSYSLITIVEH